ncbi:hypothetical protein [Ferrimonas balearica]|uniref:hypothetical protein n=1 Tax=Ferrimonas balearica TaxID=44012 RepID=UPI001C974B9D|nr:hypothetical protein [Ferrimonas balearica]MBY6224213.1 hypothetical protein [Ferrimonas balearica]
MMIPALATLHLAQQDGRLQARTELTLPPVGKHLEGLNGEAVLARLSLIYRQCSEAQRWAAISLIEEARDVRPNAVTVAARDQALALEWVTEHSWQLWRIAHEVLPTCPKRLQLLTRWRQTLAEHRDALCAMRHVPGSAVSPVALTSLRSWIAEWEALVWTPLQQALDLRSWDRLFVTPSAIQQALESGPASRVACTNPGLMARLSALWHELWLAVDAVSKPGSLTGPEGIVPPVIPGQVAAARGTLQHRCQWQEDRVTDYQITIPSSGTLTAIAASLDGVAVPESDEWRQALGVWILSHAPCMEVAIVDVTESEYA